MISQRNVAYIKMMLEHRDWSTWNTAHAAAQAASGKAPEEMTPSDWKALAAAVAAGGGAYLTAAQGAAAETAARAASTPSGSPPAGSPGTAAQITASQNASVTSTSALTANAINGGTPQQMAAESSTMPPAGFKWDSTPTNTPGLVNWQLIPATPEAQAAISANPAWQM